MIKKDEVDIIDIIKIIGNMNVKEVLIQINLDDIICISIMNVYQHLVNIVDN